MFDPPLRCRRQRHQLGRYRARE